MLCEDGCLDASAGFLPYRDGIRWDGRDAYTVTKAWLGHIAFTADPAYDGTRVLAIRSAPAGDLTATFTPLSATPLLDEVKAWRAARATVRPVA